MSLRDAHELSEVDELWQASPGCSIPTTIEKQILAHLLFSANAYFVCRRWRAHLIFLLEDEEHELYRFSVLIHAALRVSLITEDPGPYNEALSDLGRCELSRTPEISKYAWPYHVSNLPYSRQTLDNKRSNDFVDYGFYVPDNWDRGVIDALTDVHNGFVYRTLKSASVDNPISFNIRDIEGSLSQTCKSSKENGQRPPTLAREIKESDLIGLSSDACAHRHDSLLDIIEESIASDDDASDIRTIHVMREEHLRALAEARSGVSIDAYGGWTDLETGENTSHGEDASYDIHVTYDVQRHCDIDIHETMKLLMFNDYEDGDGTTGLDPTHPADRRCIAGAEYGIDLETADRLE